MKFLRDWFWPIVAGISIGIAAINYPSQESSSLPTSSGISSFKQAVNKAAPAVVSLYVQKQSTSNEDLEADAMYRLYRNLGMVRPDTKYQTVLGSGVIVRPNGYIVTNRHVISESRAIIAVLADGREAPATLIGEDENSDLAVLKIALNNLPFLDVNSETNVYVGDIALAIGNPFGVGLTVTQGIISATERIDADASTQVLIQTDAAINPGNSGGPLVNINGQLIGISTAMLGKQTEGISFALPMATTRFVVNNLISHGRVIRGWVGIGGAPISSWQAKNLNVPEGLAVTAVAPNSPAQSVGLKPGDIIIGLKAQPHASNAQIAQLVATAKPGDELEFIAWREGQNFEITISVASMPQ